MQLVPKTRYVYDDIGTKSVPTLGNDDKRQITAVVASSADGDLLPLQLIYQGKSDRCHPQLHSVSSKFHITHSQNHWSTQETMKEYVAEILQPYIEQKIIQHDLPEDMKAILVLDCWSVHKSKEFRSFMRANYPHIILIYIPPNCTSKLQVADVMLNSPFKRGLRYRFNEYAAKIIEDQIINDEEIVSFAPYLKMSMLKPKITEWCYETWNKMKDEKEKILYGWQTCVFDLYDCFDVQAQMAALVESVKQLFELEMIFEQDEDENDEDWDEADTDEEKDELDLMKEIRHGTRRSTRERKQPETLHNYMRIDPSLIQITKPKSSKKKK